MYLRKTANPIAPESLTEPSIQICKKRKETAYYFFEQ